MKAVHHDPRWTEISASLRQGKLFVKMPIGTARALCAVIETVIGLLLSPQRSYLQSEVIDFLAQEILLSQDANLRALVYSVAIEECQQDLKNLRAAGEWDHSGLIRYFCRTLEAGLEQDPKVDWITRVGGPPPDSEPLGLSPVQDPIDVDLVELLSD